MTTATVADDGVGPVEGEGLVVDLVAGEKELVVGAGCVEDAAPAGDGDNRDVLGRVDDQGNLGAVKGLDIDLVADLSSTC